MTSPGGRGLSAGGYVAWLATGAALLEKVSIPGGPGLRPAG